MRGNILIIGLGGIGGMLAEPLCRYLAYKTDLKEITLIDGDRYETKNILRQRLSRDDVGRNKAEVWAQRIASLFHELRVSAKGSYVSPENIKALIPDESTIMLCVDNHATRKLVQTHALGLKNVLLISGGNDYTDGNVQVFIKKRGRILSPAITAYHPEIAEPIDKRPDELGCDEEVAEKPQLLFANMTAACLMLNAFYGVLENKPHAGEVYFDILKNAAKPVTRKVKA